MAQIFSSIQQMAKAAGRDASRLELVVRANLHVTDKPLGNDRAIFTGTMGQIQEDTDACKQIGAHEVHFDPGFEPGQASLGSWLKRMEEVRKLV
jgi:hypothetical protein